MNHRGDIVFYGDRTDKAYIVEEVSRETELVKLCDVPEWVPRHKLSSVSIKPDCDIVPVHVGAFHGFGVEP